MSNLPTTVKARLSDIRAHHGALSGWLAAREGDTLDRKVCVAMNKSARADMRKVADDAEPPVRCGDLLGAISGMRGKLRTLAVEAGLDWPHTSAHPIGVVKSKDFDADRGRAAIQAEIMRALKLLNTAETTAREGLDYIRALTAKPVEAELVPAIAAPEPETVQP